MILTADARSIPLADASVQCVVTSPPYWQLREYGVTGGIGLEDSLELYIEQLVAVFREVRRVLRDDGILWLNLGDMWASKARGSDVGWDKSRLTNPGGVQKAQAASLRNNGERHRGKRSGVKEKELIGLPWRVVFALQADGWWVRSDIIWAKPNPLPESVTDRPSKSHEHIFLLTKRRRYFYDAFAVRTPDVGADHARACTEEIDRGQPGASPHRGLRTLIGRNGAGANLRDVWWIATTPFPEAHFATFPRALVEPCVRAGTSEKGCCPECAAPFVRRMSPSSGGLRSWHDHADDLARGQTTGGGERIFSTWTPPQMLGWRQSCTCFEALGGASQVPCVVLDPFAGSGTTGVVARRLGRRFVGLDLSPDYCRMAVRRIREEGRIRGPQSIPVTDAYEELTLL